ncbi:MAG: hypothetical protein JWP08_3598 [Bryobacterales bacterium]|jgi:hypothetical protein|nr:hypothetical protein [Bryobacterales bacterium]
MTRLTAKSSTIFITDREKTNVYRSLGDVPPELRRKLQESTQGINSATILIADKRGKEELVRALQGRPSDVQCRLADNIRAKERPDRSTRLVKNPFSLRTWLELLLPVAIGASLWLLIGSRI